MTVTPPPQPLANRAVLVLAGGLGTRLRSAVPDRQKVIAPVGGKPFVHRLIDQVTQQGASRLIFALGYHAQQVVDYLASLTFPGIKLIPSIEPEPLGTAGAIRFALPHLTGDPIVVMNGDSIAPVDFAPLLALHQTRQAQITLALAHVPDRRRFGSVELGPQDTIQRFIEKNTAPEGTPQAGFINAGVYIMNREVIAAMPANQVLSLERDFFPGYCGNGLYGLRQQGVFLDIGTPDSWRSAAEVLDRGG